MAGLEVDRRQRAGARALLEDALSVVDGNSYKAEGYRTWLTGSSESLRMVLGQAGYSDKAWAARLGPHLARWLREGLPK